MTLQHPVSPELALLACRLGDTIDPPTHPLWVPFAGLFAAELGRAPLPTDLFACMVCPCHF